MISLASAPPLAQTSRRAATIVAQEKEERDRVEERVEASTMPDRSDEPHRRPPFWIRHKKRWPVLVLVPIVLVMAAFGVDRSRFADKFNRGVTVEAKALAGLDLQQGKDVLTTHEATLREGGLDVKVQDEQLSLDPAKLGLEVDADATLSAAMAVGREGGMGAQFSWWLGSFSGEKAVALQCRLDDKALDAYFDEWERTAIKNRPFEGNVVVEGDAAVQKAPRKGQGIDRERARGLVLAALCQGLRDAPLEIPLLEVAPLRTEAQIAAATEKAQQLLSAPIVLIGELPPPSDEEKAEDGKKKKTSRARAPTKKKKKKKKDDAEEEAPKTARFTFKPAGIAKAVRTELVGTDGIEISLDPEALEPALEEARKKLERKPVDAKFVVERGDKVRIEPGRIGRVIDAKKVSLALMAAAKTTMREGALPVDEGAEPELTTAAAEGLAVKGLVSKFTTTHPCCRPRVKNIHRIADMIDGVLLKPGERFSINEHVGERTVRKGFKPAPTIVHGEMKDTVGGGISQFATTFFNAAFYGGYDIVERQPHSFYFSRYPMGHEATLSFPKPDVIIRNDTESGMLIKTYYTGVSITVKMYGDNGGRKVRRKVSRPFDLTDPPIEYIADDKLDPEETKVKVGGKKGWTVSVARIVKYPDDTEKKESRKVVYKPRVRKIRVHSCRIPEGEEGHTGDPCPEPEEDEDDEDDGEGPLDTAGGNAGSEPDEPPVDEDGSDESDE